MLRDSIIWAEQGYLSFYPDALRKAGELKDRLQISEGIVQRLQGIKSDQSAQELNAEMKALRELEEEYKINEALLKMLAEIRAQLDCTKKPIRMRLIDKGMDISTSISIPHN